MAAETNEKHIKNEAKVMRKFGVDRVPVVLLWCLTWLCQSLGYPRPPVFDGAGVPWVLTGTHQRDAASKQDDGDIRAPTLCGWCCHGRHVVMVVSEPLYVLPSNKIGTCKK